MARTRSFFVCQDCATTHPKWVGQCDGCGAWNTLAEEQVNQGAQQGLSERKGRNIEFVGLKGSEACQPRLPTCISELDRVCGGGLVPGSALLVGGDPGIGKSTLLLQTTAAIAQSDESLRCVYITGEEAINQVHIRAARLGLSDAQVELACATNVREILDFLNSRISPRVVVVDSIQTLYVDNLGSAPGTVAQVRASAQEIINLAKVAGFALFLIGHVTKEGNIAGPKVLEHMVDTVLYFEGEHGHQFRILRAVKNRFGPADEIGVFEMCDSGLIEVTNPSDLFLTDRMDNVSGTSVFAGIEGSRPMLVEIQALTASSALGTPRRTVVGWDTGRLNMILAVLETRCGIAFGSKDVYLNVVGGMKIKEPAADLAVATALISSLTGVPVPTDTIVFGEIGLSGEVRQVNQSGSRLKEAEKLCFGKAITPRGNIKQNGRKTGFNLVQREVSHLQELIDLLGSDTSDPSFTAISNRA